ncbi:MAG: hypothetical protein A2Y34_15145 [Spirochaetes bacterium GWC1_27_15]|nr:MAG: hypothetical protein A2Z98_03665 [Spirochaetes bacterium GWB1_27_13]OHD21141.1 MAG: hypothetical protein A2Y34_15145 [Spirochaetes bacterium GWC1_27_15]
MSKFIVPTVFSCIMIFSCATTKPYRKEEWKQNGITSLEKIKMGNINHSVLIRGTNIKENPILIYIHGQASPSMPFAHLEYPETGDQLELKFTVVHYDQRGVGKTAAISLPPLKSYNIEQYVTDAEDLVKYIRNKFNNQKIVIISESFGSIIGLKLIKKHPEWFAGYIGVGQMSNIKEYLNDIYKFALTNAEKENNKNALARLKSIKTKDGKLEFDKMTESQFNNTWWGLVKWYGYFLKNIYSPEKDLTKFFFKSMDKSPEYSFWDTIIYMNTYLFIYPKLGYIACKENLTEEIKEVKIPIYFVQGEFDLTNIQTKKLYDNIIAPKKEWIEIKGSGHVVRGEKPEEFNKILFEKIYTELGLKK